ncbi:hypothetical protein GLOIN_2v1526767 [Rhizophagus irregularis DAOM 181602=DAOM 197198]|uniref:Uncharacterized protein n=1 Tax=Rhizophagus irregularis (strain DAOM 181602 / DAOM 197198 / MUCL 43194) TaxID=747089 RepID=A0A2P4QP40_RHIID|nr:hypothetical protein GLOIN_2v1526767 [Rhizophagus irregularis DAOM 181602=DAOM 197198]POG79328.1 hypothetical protein GLOIN_2v1526767 [Rhizophagus irregularis DAOM 181602=DAOM 197198]|eukprot:XP_025186194.1 hypothetical protein GLOIN_2v1526767 [Rhizophagus irregularis DAOM 181602=DAOM 197198]
MSDIEDIPASTSSTSATGNETLTLTDEIKKYDTEALISSFHLASEKIIIKSIRVDPLGYPDNLQSVTTDIRIVFLLDGSDCRTVEIDDEDEEQGCALRVYFPNIIRIHLHRQKKGITMDPQFEVLGEEASGRVDYAIKKIIDAVNEELIAITEGKQKDW